MPEGTELADSDPAAGDTPTPLEFAENAMGFTFANVIWCAVSAACLQHYAMFLATAVFVLKAIVIHLRIRRMRREQPVRWKVQQHQVTSR